MLQFKAALINIFILIMDQMTAYILKAVAHGDKPTENCHPTQRLPSALQSIAAHWFYGLQLYSFGSLFQSQQPGFQQES